MTLNDACEVIRLPPRVRVAPEPERFQLRAWSGGYAIYDRGELICTFHGPQFGLASRTLWLLQNDEAQRLSDPMGAA